MIEKNQCTMKKSIIHKDEDYGAYLNDSILKHEGVTTSGYAVQCAGASRLYVGDVFSLIEGNYLCALYVRSYGLDGLACRAWDNQLSDVCV